MEDARFSKVLIFVNSLVPLVLLLLDVYRKQVGANPLEFVTRTTGMLTLIFLLVTLALTPLRRITGLNWVIKFRRMLGLYAFFYGGLHLLTYVLFDRGANLKTVPRDILQRPFIAVGITAFFLMVPLAITSTNKMVKRLGAKRWAKLHRSFLLAGVGGVLHFWMLVKSDTRLPLTFGFILLLLLVYRLLIKFVPPGQPARTSPSLFHANKLSARKAQAGCNGCRSLRAFSLDPAPLCPRYQIARHWRSSTLLSPKTFSTNTHERLELAAQHSRRRFMKDATQRFTTRVDTYARYRPGYPHEVIDLLASECGLTTDSIVADVGSGTGILSELLLKNGNEVFGVEPNAAMRPPAKTLLQAYAKFRSTDGSAEASTLPANSIDLITAGQAFHWFVAEQARAEFVRILKPGGLWH